MTCLIFILQPYVLLFIHPFIQKIFIEHLLCAPNSAMHWVCLHYFNVALPSQGLTVLWVTTQVREQEKVVVAAAPSLKHTDSDHCVSGTQYVLNKMYGV